MKQNYLKPVFIVMMLLGAFVAQAQYNLSGKVVDAKDEALAGATVVLMSADGRASVFSSPDVFLLIRWPVLWHTGLPV